MRRLTGALVLSLFILVMLSPITAMGALTRQQAVIGFSVTCFDASGGATLQPGIQPPTQSNTFAITNTIDILDGWAEADLQLPDRVLKENITRWVGALQNTTPATNNPNYGGFLGYPDAEQATLAGTYFAIQTLTIINETSTVDYDIAFNFTITLQRLNASIYPDTVGGFANTNDSVATVAATFYALEILSTPRGFPELSRINSTLAISWLNSCQVLINPNLPSYGGFVNGRNTSTPDLQSTYMAIRGLHILNGLTAINQSAALEYILSHHNQDTNYPQYFGGFGNTPDDFVSTHWATFYAVAALQLLGWTGDNVIVSQITDWIISTQTTDGGFADSHDLSGFAPQTNLAISTLQLLNQLDILQEPIGPDLYVFPWWIVGIVVLIIIIIIVLYIARRLEWF